MVADLCHVVLSCFRCEKAKMCRILSISPYLRRKGETWNVSYFRVAGRKVAMRKREKVTIWRVFAWQTFRPARRRYDTFISGEFSPSICRVFARRGKRSPRENTPRLKCRDFVFYFRIFAWRVARRKHEESNISCFRPFAFRRACAHGRF